MRLKIVFLLSAMFVFIAGQAMAQNVTYRVKPRDTLFKIARGVLGDQTRWEELCAINKALIGGQCGYVQAGIDLVLPPVKPDSNSPVLNGVYIFDMAGGAGGRFGANDGYAVSLIDGVAILRGHSENPSPAGYTGAVYLRLPDAAERAASGNRVRIDFETDPGASFQAVYSTADVGNSGWQGLNVTSGQTVSGFEYDVPEMNKGNGDFIGVQPDPENNGSKLTLKSVTVTVLGQ